jgi:mitochondrial fission protein ELM1
MARAEPKVWIFATHLTGAMNQRMGVAQRLSSDVEVIPRPGEHEQVDVPRYLANWLGDRLNNAQAWPDVIINTENWQSEIDLVLEIWRLSPKPTRIIHLEDPKHRNDEFDLIVNASHLPLIPGSNVIRPMGVASWVTPEKVAAERLKWEPRLRWLKSPVVLVAIGGNSENNTYHAEYAKDLGQRLKAVAKDQKASFLIVTSRRTPADAVMALVHELAGVPYYLFNWNLDSPEENPYLAGLGLADVVVVTGDSLSMMSDVVSLGKPLYIHAIRGSVLPEHPRLIEDYYISGRARPLVGDELRIWTYEPINVTDVIVQEIQARFGCSQLLRSP